MIFNGSFLDEFLLHQKLTRQLLEHLRRNPTSRPEVRPTWLHSHHHHEEK